MPETSLRGNGEMAIDADRFLDYVSPTNVDLGVKEEMHFAVNLYESVDFLKCSKLQGRNSRWLSVENKWSYFERERSITMK